MSLHDGIRTETRTRFIKDEGWLVEEIEVGAPIVPGQKRQAAAPKEPALPVVLTVADISLELARQVIEANGLLAVPASFLLPEQLEELAIDLSTIAKGVTEQPTTTATTTPAAPLKEKDAIKRIQAATSFEELNALTATESRTAVLNAAETRAAELKG